MNITVAYVTPALSCATGRHAWHPGDERDCADVDSLGAAMAAFMDAHPVKALDQPLPGWLNRM